MCGAVRSITSMLQHLAFFSCTRQFPDTTHIRTLLYLWMRAYVCAHTRPREAGPPSCQVARALRPVDHPYLSVPFFFFFSLLCSCVCARGQACTSTTSSRTWAGTSRRASNSPPTSCACSSARTHCSAATAAANPSPPSARYARNRSAMGPSREHMPPPLPRLVRRENMHFSAERKVRSQSVRDGSVSRAYAASPPAIGPA
eukprot:1181052-Prorocentrum_minimum.AAC.2